MDKPKNKTDAIRRHLIEHGSITSIESFELYNATRLSAIIFNLKERGYVFRTENIHKKDIYGKTVIFARYVLIGTPDGKYKA